MNVFINVSVIFIGTRTSLHKFKKLIELVEEEKGEEVEEDHQRHQRPLILLILQPTLQLQV